MLLGAHILKIILLQHSSFWELIFFQYTSLKDKNESQKEWVKLNLAFLTSYLLFISPTSAVEKGGGFR